MANDIIFGSTPEGGVGSSHGQYFIIGRVTSIVLGEFFDDGKTKNPEYNSPADVGKIDFEMLYTGLNLRRANKVSKSAFPIFSFIKQYPIIGEVVYIVSGPSDGLNDNYKNQKLFYYPPFSLWNAVNHNAFPNMDQYSEFLKYYSQQPGYQGSTDAAQAKLPLGVYFQENPKVKSLKPFEGDSLIEGRFGQSIRFGSSNPSRGDNDTWSIGVLQNDYQGKPITIITNGQGKPSVKNSDLFSPTVEDVSRDDSSIYLTSGQPLRTLNVSDIRSKKYEFPYRGNQALICSDRVMMFSKKENVLIFSKKEIGISANSTISIYSSDQVVVNSNKILLGDELASEQAMLGTTFTIQLKRLLENLVSAASYLQDASTSNPGTTAVKARIAGKQIKQASQDMLTYLNEELHLSKTTYIK
tara:strand:+ start:2278 stop:3513 length:1236 start_codon:yes stop_codon:yes gene_type:complete